MQRLLSVSHCRRKTGPDHEQLSIKREISRTVHQSGQQGQAKPGGLLIALRLGESLGTTTAELGEFHAMYVSQGPGSVANKRTLAIQACLFYATEKCPAKCYQESTGSRKLHQ